MTTDNNSITKAYGEIVVEQLTEDEREQIRAITTGHGRLKDMADALMVSRQTIYNAMNGLDMEVLTLNAIRKYLLTKKSA